MSLVRVLLWLILLFAQGLLYGQNTAEPSAISGLETPVFHDQGALYADIDTAGRRVFVVTNTNLWQYDLNRNQWKFLDSLKSISDEIADLEFGYNAEKQRLQFWSRGVGKMYFVDLPTFHVKRVDHSFNHHNQFGHYPFFYRGALYTFGGYGFWEWHNILTFYNAELSEWNIQTTDPEGVLPAERVPDTGFLNADTDELFIYGGTTTANQHPDDQVISRMALRDIWKFSFENRRWEKWMELPQEEFSFYVPRELNKIRYTNAITSSFYIPDHSLWCLPVVLKDNPDNGFYLKPVNVETHRVYNRQILGLGNSNRLIPTNYMYDPEAKEAIVIGIDNLARATTYPVRVLRISEKEIVGKLDNESLADFTKWYYLLGLGIVLIFLAWLYLKFQADPNSSKSLDLPLKRSDIEALSGFNDEEKTLLMYLFDEQHFLDTQQIEEYLWAGIENYDYRRKLRNEIITSINDKFREHQDSSGKLIIRRKDPDDKRRYLYGLNEKFVDFQGK